MLDIDVTPAAESDQLDPLALIGLRMRKTAADLVSQRATIEQRWIDDLRQYHGRYKYEQVASRKQSKRSRAFNNITRPKTNAWIAQMCDMLFPNDDKNYGIGPTPVPELSRQFDDETPALIDGEQYQDLQQIGGEQAGVIEPEDRRQHLAKGNHRPIGELDDEGAKLVVERRPERLHEKSQEQQYRKESGNRVNNQKGGLGQNVGHASILAKKFAQFRAARIGSLDSGDDGVLQSSLGHYL